MFKDRVLLAFLSGTISALLANIFLLALNQFIPGKTINMPQLTAEIFLTLKDYGIIHNVLGTIWSTIVGGAYSMIYILTLDYTGWKYKLLKALAVVNTTWLFGAGFFMRVGEVGKWIRDEPLSVGAFYIAHLFFALILFIIISKYGHKNKR